MITKFLIFSLTLVDAFFGSSLKLSSGKTLSLIGKGPPLFFSTGLYGTMPRLFYSNLVDKLKKNMTVVTLDGVNPITKKDIEDVTDTLRVDTMSYLSHSSFNPEVLETNKLNNAILIDPICLPKVNFNGIEKPYAKVDCPVLIIRAEKLYDADVPLPEWQEIEIEGDVQDEMYKDVGHPDILDDTWSEFANNLGFWNTASGELMEFKDWKYDKKNQIPQIRKDYRQYVSDKTLNFINKN
jgi:hypothetical protein